jgi:hypothetical protein
MFVLQAFSSARRHRLKVKDGSLVGSSGRSSVTIFCLKTFVVLSSESSLFAGFPAAGGHGLWQEWREQGELRCAHWRRRQQRRRFVYLLIIARLPAHLAFGGRTHPMLILSVLCLPFLQRRRTATAPSSSAAAPSTAPRALRRRRRRRRRLTSPSTGRCCASLTSTSSLRGKLSCLFRSTSVRRTSLGINPC